MNAAPNLISTSLQMLTALGVVLGGLFVCYYVAKRFIKRDVGGSQQTAIRILASRYIGVKKNIALVEVPGVVLVLGISNDRISLLTTIEDPVALEGLRRDKPIAQVSFSDHLQRLTSKIRSVKKL
jgi:flagellar biosynthetic protein FliO